MGVDAERDATHATDYRGRSLNLGIDPLRIGRSVSPPRSGFVQHWRAVKLLVLVDPFMGFRGSAIIYPHKFSAVS